jgi:hypothetical protein
MKGPRVQTFAARRVCANDRCVTVLSIYNSTDFCSLHTPPRKAVVNHVL